MWFSAEIWENYTYIVSQFDDLTTLEALLARCCFCWYSLHDTPKTVNILTLGQWHFAIHKYKLYLTWSVVKGLCTMLTTWWGDIYYTLPTGWYCKQESLSRYAVADLQTRRRCSQSYNVYSRSCAFHFRVHFFFFFAEAQSQQTHKGEGWVTHTRARERGKEQISSTANGRRVTTWNGDMAEIEVCTAQYRSW